MKDVRKVLKFSCIYEYLTYITIITTFKNKNNISTFITTIKVNVCALKICLNCDHTVVQQHKL